MSTQLHRIVAGVATVERSDPALVPSIRLAERTGAELHLVHVFEGDDPGDARADALRARLEAEVNALSQRGRITCLALSGRAGETLPALAAKLGADLMVLGRSRRGGADAAVLGITAQRVLRSSSVPVLTLQPMPSRAAHARVLLATDLSPHSAHALAVGTQLARALAEPAEPRFRPLYVTVPSYQAVAAGIPDASVEHAGDELDDFLGEVPGLAGTRGTVRIGDSAGEILVEAAEWQADLIVVGTHGRRGVPRLLLGSVAETLLRRAPVSVLVIPPAAAPRPLQVASPAAEPLRRTEPEPPTTAVPAAPAPPRRRATPPSPVPTHSILAATDLSGASDHVLRSAGAVAAATGARLHVIHAFDFASPVYLGQRVDRATFQDRIAAAEAALAAQVERTVPPGVTVGEKRVEIYAAHRAIAEYAALLDAELVVVGAHTHHGSHLGVLGSTTDRLIRTLRVPCLVVRTELGIPLHSVVVPIDLSGPSRAALEIGTRWAGALGSSGGERAMPETEVAVVHVVPRLFAVADDVPFDRATVPPGLNHAVDAAVQAAGSPANVLVREEVRWSDHPASEIVSFSWRDRADLLVLATHGDGPVRRALIGATASSVLRRAPCPVLLVPPAMWRRARAAASPARRRKSARAAVPA